MDERDYGKVVDLLYDAAVDPELWTLALERFSDAIGGEAAVMFDLSVESLHGDSVVARIDPSATAQYFAQYSDKNPLFEVNNRPRDYLLDWQPTIISDEDVLPKEDFVRSEYYNEFLTRQRIHSLLLVRLLARGSNVASVSVTRRAGREQFGGQDLETAHALHPHLIRAYKLRLKLAESRRLSDDFAHVLDQSPHGLFLLGDQGRLRHANRAGEAMLAQSLGLCLIGGRLSAATTEAARRLQALIGQALSRDPGRRTGGSMALASPYRQLPLSITVSPVNVERFDGIAADASVMVCVTDLEAGVTLPEQKARDLFGLTPAEARVALALLQGASTQEVADAQGISIQTIRVHLARIFGKTGVGRQTELISLMLRSIGMGG